MLRFLPKLFFAIVFVFEAILFGYVVYFTLISPITNLELYILLIFFFILLLIIQAFGEIMYQITLENLNDDIDYNTEDL